MGVAWRRFEAEAPEFARFVRGRFEAHGLGLLATLRRDGAPRISGIEPLISEGHLWLGMMPGSVKAADLRRDGRFALHNATTDKDVRDGDVKVNGVAVAVTDGEQVAAFLRVLPHEMDADSVELFEGEISSASSVQPAGDHLLIQSWRPGEPVQTRRRY